MSRVLKEWNLADVPAARAAMLACCGSTRWASAMAASRPMATGAEMSRTADRIWNTMQQTDWLEAFACHPRIGERKTQATGQSAAWSKQEQSSASAASERLLVELAEKNALYEERFGFTYIVCATGKTAGEMLEILERRLDSDRDGELREAAEQQRQILQIRLGKWLAA
ncbi:MAG TPA: 2-oxo-4-hydroxy-4-carboxy-5-ureidoimidazoline decarboxylase [Terracidiphilus sp.]|jgi:OHCU decarboxylase|nr:2-oxo-4-hydroxy-4-carboxy-5-ureidoimidazoline decarboxylase [Terracidiphilus sp.]